MSPGTNLCAAHVEGEANFVLRNTRLGNSDNYELIMCSDCIQHFINHLQAVWSH